MADKFNEELVSFKRHKFLAHHQFDVLRKIGEHLEEYEAAVVVDWAQNYLGEMHKEIRAFRFGQNQKHKCAQFGGYHVWSTDDNGEKKNIYFFCNCFGRLET